MQIVLASASPRRRELMTLLISEFTAEAADVDETLPAGCLPGEAVKALARRKALAMQKRYPQARILGADTVVSVDGEILGKPGSPEEAAAMLRRLSGRTHTVYTGVALLEGDDSLCFAEQADVTFATLTEEKIASYIATGEPMDKAGAYGIQGRGARLVQSICGDFYTVMGLPVCRLGQWMENKGWISTKM